MKKIIIIAIVILMIVGFIDGIKKSIAASGSVWGMHRITSTTTINRTFPRNTSEIYVVQHTTTAAFFKFNSTSPLTFTDYHLRLQRMAVTAPPDVKREEAQMWKYAVLQTTLPVNITVLYKYWNR